MNPALSSTTSGGIGGAVVVLLNAILSHFGIAATPDVVVAEATIATALAGVATHYLTKP